MSLLKLLEKLVKINNKNRNKKDYTEEELIYMDYLKKKKI